MDSRLLSDDDLIRITGKKRYSKQVEWFRDTFGVVVATADNGRIVMPWTTFEALNAKKAGLAAPETPASRVDVCSPFA